MADSPPKTLIYYNTQIFCLETVKRRRNVKARRVTKVDVFFQFYLLATVGLSIVTAILIIVYHILVGRED
jgi:hypothetical protein